MDACLIKVGNLSPSSGGMDFYAIVVAHVVSVTRGQQEKTRCADVLIGDETGCVLFTAVNDQIDTLQPGKSVLIRNFRIDMVRSMMRVSVDDLWGAVEKFEPGLRCEVNTRNNLSIQEYLWVDKKCRK